MYGHFLVRPRCHLLNGEVKAIETVEFPVFASVETVEEATVSSDEDDLRKVLVSQLVGHDIHQMPVPRRLPVLDQSLAIIDCDDGSRHLQGVYHEVP